MSLTVEIRAGLDPVVFAQTAGVDPDGWQAEALRSTSKRLIFNCSRQSGKSTVAALKALHVALYRPGSLVLLLSPSLRQSQELYRKCVDVYRAVGRPVSPESETKLTLDLQNGSRLVSLPGTDEATIRGYSAPAWVIVDEASYVEDDLILAALPMLAVSNGGLLLLGTPWDTRGFFYDAWHSDYEAWDKYEVPATECPRISPEFLETQRRIMGDWWYQREYLCRFIEGEGALFRVDDLKAMVDVGREGWQL